MCGIVGYNGHRSAAEVILKGLHRLEYRGYDSAGISTYQEGHLITTKQQGRVAALEKILEGKHSGRLGLGHTRWATHGEPNHVNAHPHLDSTGKISLVHNGIIENYMTLKQFLSDHGRTVQSDTDSEVLVEYISYVYGREKVSFPEAVRLALLNVVGAYGICVLCSDEPDILIAARLGSPLVLGVGEGEMFVASDATPIIEYTRNVVYLNDGEMAIINHNAYQVRRVVADEIVNKSEHELDMTLEQIEKGGYPHFMVKEIFEQGKTVSDAMRGRVDLKSGVVHLGGIHDWVDDILERDWLYLTACGTSWHASLYGGYLLEELAGIPTRSEYASEFRYRTALVGPRTAVIAISQSGETADTLAAIQKAREAGALAVGIVNAVGSSIARETDCGVFIHAGPEIGVASTKAFTSQLMVLLLMSMNMAQHRGRNQDELERIYSALAHLETDVKTVLSTSDSIRNLAEIYKDAANFLYLGRGYQFPVALEGALKMKEISYIHAEGYPAAEMKHGPIALIDENMPVVFLAVKDGTYSKILSNIREVKARRGRVIAVANEITDELEEYADHIIQIPTTHKWLLPLLTVIPLQLLAYHMAVLRDCNVDQPRNLAKSVTVE